MSAHLRMDQPARRHRLDEMAQGVLGKGAPRKDGPLKVSGEATYAAEWQIAGLTYGVLVRAGAVGTLRGMNRAEVEAMPGVLAVVEDERFVRNSAQGTADAAPVQDLPTIDYVGQAVALVVAESFEAARHAALALRPEIVPREGIVFDPESPDAVVDVPQDDQASQGDLDKAMAEAAHTVDVVYRTAPHSAVAMEPHASIAQWDGTTLTLRGSYQMLKYNRNELADSLGLDPGDVRILSPYVGGGFGSKLGIAAEAVAASVAAMRLGRPVSVAMTRPQTMEAVYRRTESRQRVRLAADAGGRLVGIGHEALVSNLPDEAFSEPVTQSTPFLYRGEHRQIVQKVARIHRPATGSVRSPGEALGMPVVENAMDELAVAAGIDPVALRLMNIPEVDPSEGIPYSSNTLAEALRRGAEAFGWAERARPPASCREGEWLLGVGVASASRVNNLMEAKARVTLAPDGRAHVETDMTDIGTGTYTILSQIAAEMLGLELDHVVTTLGDTDLPAGSGSGGSWGASSVGSAVYLACEAIRRELAGRLGVPETELTLTDGTAIAGNRRTPLREVLGGEALSVVGHLEPGATDGAVRQASWGAYFCEVAVSAVTGETRVRQMHGTFAAGRILNHQTARSQCLGGMTWGIGMALTEALIHDPRDGHIVNHDLAEYHIPVNLDVPQLEVLLLDERDDWANPIQSKGIGELGFCGAAAAVTNAIFNATGIRVRDYPVTLDRLLAAGLPDPD
ncbi:xanthine dehydrogenase family protein molybdopterin-binding subunit [Acuticoccus sp. I52.16.1]|uniref:xanthine dehydrogenase family protein molybdopterin-binding subunit n=1 Tax=Acuticoccus sp. I52.16.1 TaxID=2928472 RepID=UPI001FD2BF4E|nr:xanthine dehydrogenase family protein molybdopterin-binding subunit [Acuticoccus sp. I52.16.1]UOM33912.1 xanthine dehydrogenase family protein molybdopterin-binding subunit [Acuticoccus sp. I52.16.1]